jgi:5-formyltetrahydrofolate cyclo-ligase
MMAEAAVYRQKAHIRQRIIRLRNGCSSQELRSKSTLIEHRLFEIEGFQRAPVIMFYLSFRNEVHTPFMIRRAIAAGKRVAVPVVQRDEGQLLISELHDLDKELHQGSFGIPEPKPQFIRPLKLQQVGAVILPGVAFDELGYRLGYGGGYYDKLLQRANDKLLIGLAYEFQIVSRLPRLAHDVRVHKVVTEQRIIHCLD